MIAIVDDAGLPGEMAKIFSWVGVVFVSRAHVRDDEVRTVGEVHQITNMQDVDALIAAHGSPAKRASPKPRVRSNKPE